MRRATRKQISRLSDYSHVPCRVAYALRMRDTRNLSSVINPVPLIQEPKEPIIRFCVEMSAYDLVVERCNLTCGDLSELCPTRPRCGVPGQCYRSLHL
jgi:hypothetical protein